jgi:uncharacterized protein (TIGR01615 family)
MYTHGCETPSSCTRLGSEDGQFSIDDFKSSLTPQIVFSPSPVNGYGIREASVRTSDLYPAGDNDSCEEGGQQLQLLKRLEQAVHLSLRGKQQTSESLLDEVCARLAEAGFCSEVVLESSRNAKRQVVMPFRPFILVTGHMRGNVHSERTDMHAVIDFDFRSKFEIDGASSSYAAASSLLPEVFVGSSSDLQSLVAKMSKRMRGEFSAKGMSLPPWRSAAALTAIWFPLDGRQTRDFSPTTLPI